MPGGAEGPRSGSLCNPSAFSHVIADAGRLPCPAACHVRGCRCVNHPALLTEGARYFNVLITLYWTPLPFCPFLSHAALSLSVTPLPSPPPNQLKNSLSKPPEIDLSVK
ncbi:uncharacterized [Tachysurus ichikawai]